MFRTEIHIPPSSRKISLQSRLLLVGSCFSDNIGQLLLDNKLNVSANPFGVIFNPVSLCHLLETTLTQDTLPVDFYVQNGEVWYHYNLHSEVSALSKTEIHQKTGTLLENTAQFARQLTTQQPAQNFLILTFGTAYVYKLRQNRQIVANCHKMPAALFEKHLLQPQEIVDAFDNLYKLLPEDLNIILTISPIRHIKDTIPLNSVSKSILRVAVHTLCERYPNVQYFPAYEIMMDDLRDYRFYEADMLHPTRQAIDYIFERFTATYFDQPATAFAKKWSKIRQALLHRSFHPHSAAHQQFLRQLLTQLTAITEVDASQEINAVKSQIL